MSVSDRPRPSSGRCPESGGSGQGRSWTLSVIDGTKVALRLRPAPSAVLVVQDKAPNSNRKVQLWK